jgi:hypothetical protein
MYANRVATRLSSDHQHMIMQHLDKDVFYYDSDKINESLNKYSFVISEEIQKLHDFCDSAKLKYNYITIFSYVYTDRIEVSDFFVDFAEEL